MGIRAEHLKRRDKIRASLPPFKKQRKPRLSESDEWTQAHQTREQVKQIEEWILMGLPNNEVKLNARLKYNLKWYQVHGLIHQAWKNLVGRLNARQQRQRAQSALNS